MEKILSSNIFAPSILESFLLPKVVMILRTSNWDAYFLNGNKTSKF